MRILLDTHIALWAIISDARLPEPARELIADPNNELSVSAASIWEIAIKHALARSGRGQMPVPADEAVGYFATAGYTLLPIAAAHAAAVEALPPIHTDPFDRLLVAQALYEPLRLMTADKGLGAYSETILVV